jgi:hypothetical protein
MPNCLLLSLVWCWRLFITLSPTSHNFVGASSIAEKRECTRTRTRTRTHVHLYGASSPCSHGVRVMLQKKERKKAFSCGGWGLDCIKIWVSNPFLYIFNSSSVWLSHSFPLRAGCVWFYKFLFVFLFMPFHFWVQGSY